MRARGGIRPLAGMMGAGFVGVVLVMALVSDGGRPALHGAAARARALARALSLILLHSQRAGSVHRASVLRACMLLSSSTLVMHAKILEPGRSKKMLSLPSHLTRNTAALCLHQGLRERCSSCTEGTIPSRCTWEIGEPTTRPSGAATTQTAISEMWQRTRRRHTFSKVLDTVTSYSDSPEFVSGVCRPFTARHNQRQLQGGAAEPLPWAKELRA